MEYTTLDVKRIANNYLYCYDLESSIDFLNALKCVRLDENTRIVLSLYMCNLTTYEVGQILSQLNYILFSSVSLLLEEAINKITDKMNSGCYDCHNKLKEADCIHDLLNRKEIVLPTIKIVTDVQNRLSKFDNRMKEAINSNYEYIEEPIQLRRQEEMVSARIKYNFIDYDRKYHSVSEYKDELGESNG